MGILDDAIREHLELKRRLGADDAELARLEDEAFGPPSRPGEPDFPGQQEGGQASAAAVTTEAPPARAEAPAEQAPAEGPPGEAPSEPAATLFHDQEAEERAEAVPVEAPPPREPTPAEPPKHPSEAPPAAETSAPEPPRTEDEPAERPIESLDTVEHPFEGAMEDTGEAEVVEGELEEGRELEGEEEGEGEDEDDDVLEETPEFLRDAPEDDELWFEQGEPRDFDF